MPDANVRTSDPRNYQLPGSVSLWFRSRGTTGPWDDLGNVINPNIEQLLEELEHFSQRRGLRAKDKEVISQREAQLKFSIDEFNVENLRKAFGQPESEEVGSYTAHFNKVAVNPGANGTVNLGQTAVSAVAVRGVGLETPAEYVEETMATDSTDDTQGGDFNNTTAPLTVTGAVTNYPNITFVVGLLLKLENEILRVTAVNGNDVTFARAQFGTTAAAHANGVSVFVSTADGDYLVDYANGRVHPLSLGELADPEDVEELHVYFEKVVDTKKFSIFPGATFEGQAKFQVFTPGGLKYAIEFRSVVIRSDGAFAIGDGTAWQEVPLRMDALQDEDGELGTLHVLDEDEVA
jgi:hypothetical protein